ncbi:hypothetical protein BHE74_00016968 [Ensete ventricosum]|nr:hypothetical protein BHE74_00016968 [Ensete ventricosum]
MEDRPSLTRWSFEDFKLFYDVRFGRKRSSKGEAEEDASSGSRHGGIRANGMVTANGSVKRSSDLAVYEQFERQVGGSHPRFSSCVRFDLLSCSAAFIGPAVSAFDLTFYFFLLLMSVGAEDRATGWSYFRQGCKAVLTQMQSGTDIDAERRSTSTLVPTQFSSGVYANVEYRHLHVVIYRDIVRGSPDVKWESIKGLENAKRLLKEAVVMPIKYPK